MQTTSRKSEMLFVRGESAACLGDDLTLTVRRR